MSITAYYNALLLGSATSTPPPPPPAAEQSAFFGQNDGTNSSALLFPAIANARAISFLIKPYVPFSTSAGFLLDGRDQNPGDPYIYGPGSSVQPYYGSETANYLSSQYMPAGQWTRVYVALYPTVGPTHLLSRYSKNEFFVACNLAHLRVYSRTWSSTEITSSNPLAMPADSVLAHYPLSSLSNGTFADQTGQNAPATLFGPTPTFN